MRSYPLFVDLSACTNGLLLFRKPFPVPVSSGLFPTLSSVKLGTLGFVLQSLIPLELSLVKREGLDLCAVFCLKPLFSQCPVEYAVFPVCIPYFIKIRHSYVCGFMSWSPIKFQ